MSMTTSSEADRAAGLGFMERALRYFMRSAHVSNVTQLSDQVRLITLRGDDLKGCAWVPGDKIQLKLGRGLTARTYTPVEWDHMGGITGVVVFNHGRGLGADWSRTAMLGDELHLIGPRSSLALAGWMAPTVLFGDETSFGLAAAMKGHALVGASARVVLEVDDRTGAHAVLANLGLRDVELVTRWRGSAHLGSVVEEILDAGRDATYVLTGKAPSIEHVCRALKSEGVAPSRMKMRALWAPGKVGLG